MSDIFREVDEEVRREQLKKLWQRYGNHVVAAAILVVAAVAAWRGYGWWEAKRAAEAGAAFEAAGNLADAGKLSEAEVAFARIAADGTASYRHLARVREAAALAHPFREYWGGKTLYSDGWQASLPDRDRLGDLPPAR